MRPSLAVYNLVFKVASKSAQTFHKLPSPDTPYPFVYVSQNVTTPSDFKVEEYGRISQTFSIWGLENHRSELSEIASNIQRDLRLKQNSISGDYHFKVIDFNEQHIDDNSTDTHLLHLHITMNFNFNKRS